MKITIELPDNLLDEDALNNIVFVTETIKDRVKREVLKALAEKYLENAPDIQDLDITTQDIKEAVKEVLENNA